MSISSRVSVLIAVSLILCVVQEADSCYQTFDKTAIEIGSSCGTDTVTFSDSSGHRSHLEVEVGDPSVVEVTPASTDYVNSQVFTVKALKGGSTAIYFYYTGNPADGCGAAGTHVVEVVVQETEACIKINVTAEFGAQEGGDVGIRLTVHRAAGEPVQVDVTYHINAGDKTESIAQGLRAAIAQALSDAGLNCTVEVRPTQFDTVLSVYITCTCAQSIDGNFTTAEAVPGTGISIVECPQDPEPPEPTPTFTPTPTNTSTPTNTHTPTPTPSFTVTPTEIPPTYTYTPTNTPIPFAISLDVHPIQVIQHPADSLINEDIPLIKDKATMVRVFVIWSPPDPTTIHAICRLDIDGRTEQIEADVTYSGGQTTVTPTDGTYTPPGSEHAFNFQFPPDGYYPSGASMQTEARLISGGATLARRVEEFDLCDFTDRNRDGEFVVKFMAMETGASPTTKTRAELRQTAVDQLARLTAIYPIPHRKASAYIDVTSIDFDDIWVWKWYATLTLFEPDYVDFFVVFTSPALLDNWVGLTGVAGYAPQSYNRLCFVNEAYPALTYTTAHEIYHQVIGPGHPGGTNGDGWDVRWVTRPSLIIPNRPLSIVSALMVPTANRDNNGWIRLEEYRRLLGQMTNCGAGKGGLKRPLAEEGNTRIIFVSGDILTDYSIRLNPMFEAIGTPYSSISGGEHLAQCVSANQQVLSEHRFRVFAPGSPEDNDSEVPDDVRSSVFGFYMSFPEGTASVQIVKDGVVLAQRNVSPNAPVINVSSFTPVGDQGIYQVDLNASDADGDDLSYTAAYSPDGRRSYYVEIQWVEEGARFQFDASELPGGENARIRVMVTDGANSNYDDSPETRFQGKPPSPFIEEPTTGSLFDPNSEIYFAGKAYDPEDGILRDASLSWTSDRVGEPLGTGENIIVSNLPMGDHVITLTATDSEGTVGTTTVTIRIETIPTVTPTPTETPTPAATRLPDQILVSQGYGGSTVSKRLQLTGQGWRLVPFSSFQDLPIAYAQNVVQSIRERSVNTTVADIDGDGVKDIVCGLGPGGMGSKQPSIIIAWQQFPDRRPGRMTVKGVYSLNATNPKLQNPHGALNVAAGNFVGDDLPMIAAAQGLGGSHQIRMLQYTPQGDRGILDDVGTLRGLQQEALWGNSSGGTAVAPGDLDGDGLDELVVGQMNGDNATSLFQVLNLKRDESTNNVVVDTYTDPVAAFPTDRQGLGGVNLCVGDVNGDGQNEIIVASAGKPGAGGKNFVCAFSVEVNESGVITGLSALTQPVQVWGAVQNPSGGLSITVGNFDDDIADEVLVGTQAIIHLDLGTGAVTFTDAAPRPLMKGLNFDFAEDGSFTGISSVSTLPGNQPFDGNLIPTSRGVNVEVYSTD
ncbi:MAG: FG-GAP repeat protein [bacterium]